MTTYPKDSKVFACPDEGTQCTQELISGGDEGAPDPVSVSGTP